MGRENFLTSAEELSCYSYDGTGRSYMPDAVALPGSAAEISALLLLANQHKFPVVPRGAGTGMTGGSLPVAGGLVLVTSRMNRILDIDSVNMTAVVEPGVVTGDLQAALQKHNLMYPPDPASLKFCSLGGNIAECAGGPSAVKYGVTKDYILGLEVVLPTGELLHTGVRTEKGVVGYDLTRLFVGSEGTLGVISKIIIRLLPLPEKKETYLLSFNSLHKAAAMVSELLASGLTPCTLEYMDKTTIDLVRDQISLELADGTRALLILEIDGSAAEVEQQQHNLHRFLAQKGISHVHAENDEQYAAIWQARRSISPASFSLKPDKISEDIVVPRSRIPDLVAFTEKMGRERDLAILTFGHAGDGNIHVNIMIDRRNSDETERGEKARKELFAFVIQLGGTLSGEHGIGITKAPFLTMELDATVVSVMQKIKHLFDPNSILNPGKIFPGTL